MSIERVVYGSIKVGLDSVGSSDSSGYQRYSYTPGYKSLIQGDPQLERRLESSYSSPKLYSMYDEYNQKETRTEADRNAVSDRIDTLLPKGFCFWKQDINGETRYCFSFGKNSGFDWSGGRPNACYQYSVVCREEDIKQNPVFYCSSPSVCCDVPRRSFFPEDGGLPETRALSYITDLSKDDPDFPVKHVAGFEKISAEQIHRFISTGNRVSILKSMIMSLLRYKTDPEQNNRIIIADTKDNNLMWIALISFLFPVKNTLDLSFATYADDVMTYEYDITGVFFPSINGFESDEDIVTKFGYDAEWATKNTEFYDFCHDEVNTENGEGAFFDVLIDNISISFSPLDAYKSFIEKETTYAGLNLDYIKGYDLYLLLSGKKIRYDFENAIEFASKYANPSCVRQVNEYLCQNYQAVLTHSASRESVMDYLKEEIHTNLQFNQELHERVFADLSESITKEDESILDLQVETATKVFGVSEEQVRATIIQTIGWKKAGEMLETTKTKWKKDFILDALFDSVNSGSAHVVRDGELYSLFQKYTSSTLLQHPESVLKELENLKSRCNPVADRFWICDAVASEFDKNQQKEGTVNAIGSCVRDYYNGRESYQNAILKLMKQSQHKNLYYHLISRYRVQSDDRLGTYVLPFSSLSHFEPDLPSDVRDMMYKRIVDNMRNETKLSPDQIRSVYSLIKSLDASAKPEMDKGVIKSLTSKLIMFLREAHPDMVYEESDFELIQSLTHSLSPNEAEELEQYVLPMKEISLLSTIVKKRVIINDAREFASLAPDYAGIYEAEIRNQYLKTIASLAGEYWLESKRYIDEEYLIKSSNKEMETQMYDMYFYFLMETLIKSDKKYSYQLISQMIELSILRKENGMIKDFWENSLNLLRTSDCFKAVMKALKEDRDKIATARKKQMSVSSSENPFLQNLTDTQIESRIMDIESSTDSGKGFGISGFKNLFKKKQKEE